MSTGDGPGPYWEEPARGLDDGAPAGPAGRWDQLLSVARVATASALVILVVGGAVVLLKGNASDPVPPRQAVGAGPSASATPAAGTTTATAPTEPAGFGRFLGSFGGQGSGPGLLDDPREVTVDAEGDVWVGDYEDGRLQEFGPDGTFKRVINVPVDDEGDPQIITGLAADLKSKVFVAAGGSVYAYDSRTGKPVWKYVTTWPSGPWIDDVAVTATGVLYGLQGQATANVLHRFSSTGKPGKHWDDIVQKVNHKDPAMDLKFDIDGLGHFYISSSFGSQVYHYDAAAKFVDRFGEEGDLPGQLDSPGSIAADGHGRLYIDGFDGIDQYAVGGRFIARFSPAPDLGVPMGLAVDRDDVLLVVTNAGLVLRYQLAAP